MFIVLVSCKHAPKVTLCVSDPIVGGFQCEDPEEHAFVLPYSESENYVALSPSDAQALFLYCKSKIR